MKKILSIGQKQILSGLNDSATMQSGGLWLSAAGLNPFLDSSTLQGLIAASPAATDVTNGVPGAYIWDSAFRYATSSASKLYFWGADGILSYVTAPSNSNLTAVNAAAGVSSPANGLEIFKAAGGSELMYYWQTTQIGTYDFNATWAGHHTDAAYTGLTSTTNHHTHRFLDSIYYANGPYIGRLYDSAGTVTNTVQALDFPANYNVICLEDDGQFLVASVSTNVDEPNTGGVNKIIFWDTSSSSWSKEHAMNFQVTAMKRVGATLYAITSEGIYVFNYGTPPIKVRSLDYGTDACVYPNAIAQYGDGIIFGSGLMSYGKAIPGVPNAPFRPFTVSSGTPTIIVNDARIQRLWVGTSTPKMYRFTPTAAGTASEWTTIYIDLEHRYRIQMLNFVFPNGVNGSDQINISITNGNNAFGYSAINGSSHIGETSVKSYPDPTSSSGAACEGEHMQLKITFAAGAPAISRIDVYGEPVLIV